MNQKLISEKIAQAVEILNEKNINMWMTFVRESSIITDPVLEIILGKNSTWESAFIMRRAGDTPAIVGSMELENFEGNSGFKNVIGYLKSVKEPLLEYIKSKNPKSIAINYSQNSVLADGLSHGLYINLLNYLSGTGFEDKLISSEEIVSALKGRKSPTEFKIMKEAVDETLLLFDEATKFIKPGVTEIEIGNFVKELAFKKGFELAWEEDHCPPVFTRPDPHSPHAGSTDRKAEKDEL